MPALEGVSVRLNDDDLDSEPVVRGIGVGELNVWPVGAASSRKRCMSARTTASMSRVAYKSDGKYFQL